MKIYSSFPSIDVTLILQADIKKEKRKTNNNKKNKQANQD